MLGVAIPGIAPTNPGLPRAPDSSGALPPPPAPVAQSFRSRVANTALGQTPVLPAPAPFVDDVPLPQAPSRAPKKGVPVTVVAGIVGALVLVGGAVIFLLAHGATPLVAQPRLDAQGNEVLHLQCEDCPDGTVATLDTANATFKAKEADLPLPKPLDVGDNKLVVKIDRPNAGRDEEVSLVVPLAFNIRADLADIAAKPSVITVRVAAAPGTDVSVDGKPLALDATGKGAYAVDVSADTEGATEDVRVIDRKIPYVVTMKGASRRAAW